VGSTMGHSGALLICVPCECNVSLDKTGALYITVNEYFNVQSGDFGLENRWPP